MTFAGTLIGCWLAIAGLAFLAISGLGRLAAHGDVESDLGIVGEAELRMLVAYRGEEQHAPHSVWTAWDRSGPDYVGYTT
jgi:hypothetical protein